MPRDGQEEDDAGQSEEDDEEPRGDHGPRVPRAVDGDEVIPHSEIQEVADEQPLDVARGDRREEADVAEEDGEGAEPAEEVGGLGVDGGDAHEAEGDLRREHDVDAREEVDEALEEEDVEQEAQQQRAGGGREAGGGGGGGAEVGQGGGAAAGLGLGLEGGLEGLEEEVALVARGEGEAREERGAGAGDDGGAEVAGGVLDGLDVAGLGGDGGLLGVGEGEGEL